MSIRFALAALMLGCGCSFAWAKGPPSGGKDAKPENGKEAPCTKDRSLPALLFAAHFP